MISCSNANFCSNSQLTTQTKVRDIVVRANAKIHILSYFHAFFPEISTKMMRMPMTKMKRKEPNAPA